jgi:flagellar protein FliS
MVYSAAQQYQQNKVLTATPGELTLMLYNGLVKFIKLAIHENEQGNIAGVNTNLLKSQDIIKELLCTLDMKIKVAENMAVMYDYMLRRLMEANVKKDSEIMKEILGYAEEFRDMWIQVMKLAK